MTHDLSLLALLYSLLLPIFGGGYWWVLHGLHAHYGIEHTGKDDDQPGETKYDKKIGTDVFLFQFAITLFPVGILGYFIGANIYALFFVFLVSPLITSALTAKWRRRRSVSNGIFQLINGFTVWVVWLIREKIGYAKCLDRLTTEPTNSQCVEFRSFMISSFNTAIGACLVIAVFAFGLLFTIKKDSNLWHWNVHDKEHTILFILFVFATVWIMGVPFFLVYIPSLLSLNVY